MSDISNIEKNVFRIGENLTAPGSLDPNIYLIDYENTAVLINTGTADFFPVLKKRIESILPPEKIGTIVITNTDADLCSSLSSVKKLCMNAEIALHWRSYISLKRIVRDISFFIVNENNWEKDLGGGKKLLFLPASYLCMPGEIMVYEPDSMVLFSSTLLSSFTSEDSYKGGYMCLEALKSYHEHFIPDTRISRNIIERLKPLSIKKIAPARGCIISENISSIMNTIASVNAGSFSEIKKTEIHDSGIYKEFCIEVIRRYCGLYSEKEVLDIFSESEIIIDSSAWAVNSETLDGKELWEYLFSRVLEKKGIKWLSIIESLVRKISRKYSLSFPSAFQKVILNLDSMNLSIDKNLVKVQGTKKRISAELQDAGERLTTCHVTGFKNDAFFRIYLEKEFEQASENEVNSSLLMLALDNINEINSRYGREGGDEALRGISYLLKNFIAESDHRAADSLFKLNGAVFAYFIPDCLKDCALKTAERLREKIARSSVFIEDVTVSIGIVNFYEFIGEETEAYKTVNRIIETGFERIHAARKGGGNTICEKSDETAAAMIVNSPVIIIDTDDSFSDILITRLEGKGIKTVLIHDGEEAVEKIRKYLPPVIISETMIPGINGFVIREGLLSDASLSSIPYIITSHKKNDEFIKKAYSLNIVHYFLKPYSVLELSGLVENLIRQRNT